MPAPDTQNPVPESDIFADIAEDFTADDTPGFAACPPPALPDKTLSWTGDNQGAFSPVPPMAEQSELDEALIEARSRYEPFMRDLAPDLETRRTVQALSVFDHRTETDADRVDFNHTLSGGGEWQQVTVPHYGGPEGRAVAWYRCELDLDAEFFARDQLFVHFEGVDYLATVFLNGHLLGKHEGLFDSFEFEFKRYARPGRNTLLVKVENDYIMMGSLPIPDGSQLSGEKIAAVGGPGWDEPGKGWHVCPVGFGLWQDVRIEGRSAFFIHDIFVRPQPDQMRAEVWVEVAGSNPREQEVEVRWSLYGQNFTATIAADQEGASGPVGMGPSLLKFHIPITEEQLRWWSPETPWLYQLQLALHVEGECIDTAARQFGMRTFTQDEENVPKGRLYLNGKEIRLRGANVMGNLKQCVMQKDWDQLRDDILLAKIANQNFWRFTQQPCQRAVYDFCDRLGIMTQTDMPLFSVVRPTQFAEVVRQAGAMERLVRHHPCNILVSYINEPMDKWPHRHMCPDDMRGLLKALDPIVRLHNPDRVIKPVDGDYVNLHRGWSDHHCYTGWYHNHGISLGRLHQGEWLASFEGWMHGCGEFGAEGLDDVELMRRHYPSEWLPQTEEEEATWEIPAVSCIQSSRNQPLWFERPATLQGWVDTTHRHQAVVTRMMTEAYRRDPLMNSYAVHLLIDAFPAGWLKTLMNCERRAKPAYFAYREANTPLLVNLRSDRRSWFGGECARLEAWVCNDTHDLHQGAELRYHVEVDGVDQGGGRARAEVPDCSTQFQGFIPYELPHVEKRCVVRLRLALVGKDGQVLHDTAFEADVFPALRRHHGAVCVVGRSDGPAVQLAAALGQEVDLSGSVGPDAVILIDDRSAYEARAEEIDKAVSSGARALFVDAGEGDYLIGGDAVRVGPRGGDVYALSRATGHEAVVGYRADEFKLLYDVDAGRINTFSYSWINASEAWRSVLTSCGGRPVLVDREDGEGRWVVCGVDFVPFIEGNALVSDMFRRLLGMT